MTDHKAGGQPAGVDLTEQMAEIARRSQSLMNEFLSRQQRGDKPLQGDFAAVSQAFGALAERMIANPMQLVEAQMRWWQGYGELWQRSAERFVQSDKTEENPGAAADRRFRHDAWNDSFVFEFLRDSYLFTSKWLMETVGAVEGLGPQDRQRVEFFTRQFVDAMSPANSALTNPEVLQATVQSGGRNLLEGFKNLLEDLERGGGQLRIRMTDESAFELGVNVAVTPGAVVFENELMQLIQYSPATPQVYRRPLLVIPPWINKYYILDLREKNSFVKWWVEQGFTVFMISWVNPDEALADKTFDDYLLEGPIAALDAIQTATGEREALSVGYCLGGTLLAATLAWLKARKDDRIRSATFFTSMIDFAQPGDLGVFIDEAQIEALERQMQETGYLDGAAMAQTFNMLRANDLIWSFVVNNYLLGKEPMPFDLLYWNADSTNMPAAMHSFYLRKMYQENLLRVPGGLTIAGEAIDLGVVDVPCYFLSTEEDHIAPWRATYEGARLLGERVRFVLGRSGHIAGVINPPAANKYGYWTTSGALPEEPDRWLESATYQDGSWWPNWLGWQRRRAGKKVAARTPGDSGLPVIEPAPGRYVKVRSG